MSLKLTLYKRLFRSKLKCASSAWDFITDTLIILILVHNSSACFILHNYDRAASITSIKNTRHLPPFSSRRRFSRLCKIHKIFYHTSYLREELILPPIYVSSRVDHVHKVGVPHCITRASLQSFIPRTLKEWNHLPDLQRSRSALADIVYSAVLQACNHVIDFFVLFVFLYPPPLKYLWPGG